MSPLLFLMIGHMLPPPPGMERLFPLAQVQKVQASWLLAVVAEVR